MANPWFRMYHEFDSDPKVQMMSETMQRRLVMLFCSQCKGGLINESELAFHWRISEAELSETKAIFIQKGFIDDTWKVLKWDDRQFISDSSAERVKRYRDKREKSGLNRGSSHLSDPLLFKRDCNRCIYCLSTKNLCIDHMYPIQLGGSDHYDNLAVACKVCNSGKAGRTPESAKLMIKNKDAIERYERYVTVTLPIEHSVINAPRTDTEQNRTEQIHKNQKTTPKATPSWVAVPDWISDRTWDAFEEMRKRIRKPLTDRARELTFAKLDRWRKEGQDPEAILNRSIEGSWTGLYPIDNPASGASLPACPVRTEETARQEEIEGYEMWLGMNDAFRKANPRTPPEGYEVRA